MRTVLFVLLLVGYFAYQEGLLDDFIAEVNLVSKDIMDMGCEEDVIPMIEGQFLQNLVGGTFEIVKVLNATEQSRSEAEIVCIGDAMLSNASRPKLMMKIFKVGDDIMYEVRPL